MSARGKYQGLELDPAWLKEHPKYREDFHGRQFSMLDLRAMVHETGCLPIGSIWVRRDGMRFRVEKHRIVEVR